MAGDKDLPRPPSEAKEMAKLIGCEYIEIKNAGHIANLEQPEFVNTQLQNFFQQNNI